MVDKYPIKNNYNTKTLVTIFQNITKHSSQKEIKQLIYLFDKQDLSNKHLILCCSWWPDSMFLTCLLLWYRHIVNRHDVSITKILHINHNTSESDLELLGIVEKLFIDFSLFVRHIPGKNHTETALRKKRRDFYEETIQQYSGTSVYLCLWHHLDDRIENSFLHMERWTDLFGIINMEEVKTKKLFFAWWYNEYVCFRPLLKYTKKNIEQWCRKFCIPYGYDIHNNDVSQKRIMYRNVIQQLPPDTKKQLYTEWSWVYKYSTKQLPTYNAWYVPILFPSFFKIWWLYKIIPPENVYELRQLLSDMHIFFNMSRSRLEELMRWFYQKKGYVYLHWRWFLYANWNLYTALQPVKTLFWEDVYKGVQYKYGHLYGLPIQDWIEEIANYDSIITPIQEGAVYKWKSLLKYLAKKGVPFFFRRALPIVKKNNIITAVLPQTYWRWK